MGRPMSRAAIGDMDRTTGHTLTQIRSHFVLLHGVYSVRHAPDKVLICRIRILRAEWRSASFP